MSHCNYILMAQVETIFRQGDLLIERVDAPIPKNAKVFNNNGVLALGEKTGHKHRCVPATVVYQNEKGQELINLEQPTQLVHEEHNTIGLDPGTYVITHEREYNPFKEAARQVAD